MIKKDENDVLYSPAYLRPETVFSVESQMDFVQGHPFGGFEMLDDPAPYLQLPDTLSARTLKLGEEIVSGIVMPFEQALEIERVLNEDYTYTLETAFDEDDTQDLDHFI